MDVSELSMLLESIDCHEVSNDELEQAMKASKKLSNLDTNQQLLLYGLFKQCTIGDINVPEPDKQDIVGSSKWQIWKSFAGFPKNSAAIAYVYIVNEMTEGRDLSLFDKLNSKSDLLEGLGSAAVSTLNQADSRNIVPWSSSEKVFQTVVDDNIDLLRQYIAEGIDVNCPSDNGMRPLHFAADRGYSEIVELLATAGATVDVEDDAGMTPLMYAASCDHLATVTLLASKFGANTNIQKMIDFDDLSEDVKSFLQTIKSS